MVAGRLDQFAFDFLPKMIAQTAIITRPRIDSSPTMSPISGYMVVLL